MNLAPGIDVSLTFKATSVHLLPWMNFNPFPGCGELFPPGFLASFSPKAYTLASNSRDKEESVMDKVVLQAADLDGYLTAADQEAIASVGDLYGRALDDFAFLESGEVPEGQRRRGTAACPFQRVGRKDAGSGRRGTAHPCLFAGNAGVHPRRSLAPGGQAARRAHRQSRNSSTISSAPTKCSSTWLLPGRIAESVTRSSCARR